MKFSLASVTSFRHTRESKGKQSMKMKEIRNGSLYFNEENKRVERVIGTISSQRVVTYHHKEDEKYPQTEKLRLATDSEVKSYLSD